MRTAHDIGALLRQNQDQLTTLVPNTWKSRTLFALSRCRTAEMGGHIDKCSNPKCNKLHLSYNSCRNRHCPKCQGHKREEWIAAREAELLNCSYFHVVFTLPDALNELVLQEPRYCYAALFKVAWSVMKTFAHDTKHLGAQTGMTAVLHSWGQNLNLHPHLHCIVPSGGVTTSGKWKYAKTKGKYLFPVKQLSKVFKARYIAALRKQFPDYNFDPVYKKKWVVFAKQPFYGPKQVIEYLGRYTHKIAISNHRLKSVSADSVTFSYKNYRHGGKKGEITLSHKEFIRRFALHILPKGFTRIRHYGILSSGKKKDIKTVVDQQLGVVEIRSKTSLHRVCPSCKKGKLVTIYTFGQRGPPDNWRALFSELTT